MPKATAVFDADDSRLSGALARINGKMLALQSRIAKFAAAGSHPTNRRIVSVGMNKVSGPAGVGSNPKRA